ncbi:MAG: hypothetical protein KHX36_11720 [Clostridiales bacterium]|nr:hypothetical protein [Clostridiales bacterium]
MTISAAIAACDRMRPNTFAYGEKEAWLRELEARIREEIVRTHEGAEAFLAGRAQEGEDALLAPSPHESLYLFYLLARIDLMNGETARYNESAALFNAQYDAFSAAYNRAHRPRGAFVDRREWT